MSMYLTTIEGWPDKRDARPGMAHYAGSGPEKKTCGQCKHRGYSPDKFSKKHNGCAKFRALTNMDGPEVKSDWRACILRAEGGKEMIREDTDRSDALCRAVFDLIDEQCPISEGEVMIVAINMLANVYAMAPLDRRPAMARDIMFALQIAFGEIDGAGHG
jgi:hypothetical protein